MLRWSLLHIVRLSVGSDSFSRLWAVLQQEHLLNDRVAAMLQQVLETSRPTSNLLHCLPDQSGLPAAPSYGFQLLRIKITLMTDGNHAGSGAGVLGIGASPVCMLRRTS